MHGNCDGNFRKKQLLTTKFLNVKKLPFNLDTSISRDEILFLAIQVFLDEILDVAHIQHIPVSLGVRQSYIIVLQSSEVGLASRELPIVTLASPVHLEGDSGVHVFSVVAILLIVSSVNKALNKAPGTLGEITNSQTGGTEIGQHIVLAEHFPELEIGATEDISLFFVVDDAFVVAFGGDVFGTVDVDELVGVEQKLDGVPHVVIGVNFGLGAIHQLVVPQLAVGLGQRFLFLDGHAERGIGVMLEGMAERSRERFKVETL